MSFLKSLSLNTIAILAIVGGLIFIIVSDPPKTICNAEIESFQAGTRGFLYINPSATVKVVRYHELAENCKRSNSPGGCIELFNGLKKVLLELNSVSLKCLPEVGELKEVRGSVFRSLDLMAKLAWGVQPPAHANLKVGFFDPGDLNLFCRLKQKSIEIYGDNEWSQFQKQTLNSLPGISLIPKQEAWDKSLFSLSCQQYL